ncbi:MAG: sigma-70 family RNA polymerase sigma factor [Planctomycetes bacterium]|nr:sigma-70 family RNA polymerase sigma factor [Planctomycetota bacterium]
MVEPSRSKPPYDPAIDGQTLRTLLREHEPKLYRRIRRKLAIHTQSVIAPEDILQEIWTAAFLRLTSGNWDSIAGFERWLTYVTSSKVNAWMRRFKTAKWPGSARLSSAGDAHKVVDRLPGARMPAPEQTPSREAAAHEAADAINKGIDGLPPQRRNVVRMRYLEGQSLAEIAKACKISVSTVRVHLYRGIRQLRKELGHAGKFFTDADSSTDGVQ